VNNRKNVGSDPHADQSALYELSLEDTLAQKMRGLPATTRVPAGGYDPYDATAASGSRKPTRKSTDLRKLSQWIRIQRQVNDLKKPGSDEAGG
jgi:hypothetical protein